QFEDTETVAGFKTRVFGHEIGEDQKCRLIAGGKELKDSQQMGFYRLPEDSCLHVMISRKVSSGFAARASPSVASPGASASAAAASSRTVSGEAGSAILCALTLGMVIAGWTLFVVFPGLFSSEAISLLVVLTLLQLAATLPLLKKALSVALGACWWRRPSGDSRISSRVPGRRRQ
ncbi:unnamed protein product, partial [Hapterophycus canaliculatus]